jgi:catechol-2,3-dioxygenase
MNPLALSHYNFRAHRDLLERLRVFYCDVVGLSVGYRPPFTSFGYWLYAGDDAVLHLTEAAPTEVRPEGAVATFDHAAFSCHDRGSWERMLTERGIAYEVSPIPLTSQMQIAFRDLAGNGVELIFSDELR